MPTKLLIANWKMNPVTEKQVVRLAKASDASNVVIAPPFTFLALVRSVIKKAALGAQDVFWESHGAYTGEVSGVMLKDLGVRYAILGHSERRALGETDKIVNKKIKAAFNAGLKVVLCVGEPWQVRKKGIAPAKRFIEKQLRIDLSAIGKYKIKNNQLIIAYEPIWAISTSRSASFKDNADTPENAAVMMRFIRSFAGRILMNRNLLVFYGGSVNGKNAESFLGNSEIDGVLVGGASLRPKEFRSIIKIAQSF